MPVEVGVFWVQAVALRRGPQGLGVDVAQGDHLGVRQAHEVGDVGAVGPAPAPLHRYAHSVQSSAPMECLSFAVVGATHGR